MFVYMYTYFFLLCFDCYRCGPCGPLSYQNKQLKKKKKSQVAVLFSVSDASSGVPPKQRLTDSAHPNHFLIRADPEPVTMYSPEQTSLHESEGLFHAFIFTILQSFTYSISPALGSTAQLIEIIFLFRILRQFKKLNTNELVL